MRAAGYAIAVDELEVGLTAVAAPIRNAHGDIVASLSVSGPTFRLDEERVDEVLPALLEAAGEISHRLGLAERLTRDGCCLLCDSVVRYATTYRAALSEG